VEEDEEEEEKEEEEEGEEEEGWCWSTRAWSCITALSRPYDEPKSSHDRSRRAVEYTIQFAGCSRTRAT